VFGDGSKGGHQPYKTVYRQKWPRGPMVTGKSSVAMHPQIESQEYLIRATEAEKRGAQIRDPAMKAVYVKLAAQYRRLAREAAER
jgi:hypothetical protein